MFGGLLRRDSQTAEARATYTFQQLGMMVADGDVELALPDNEEALRNAAVWACIDVIASSIASLPIDAVRVVDDVRVPISPTPSLLEMPSAYSTLDVWLYQLAFSLLDDGNAFGYVTAVDRNQRPTSIELIDPKDVQRREVRAGVPYVTIGDKERGLYPYGDVWHVPGKMTRPGSPFALSPRYYARTSIGAALAAERFSANFFTRGGHPTSIIYSDQNLTPDQAEGIKRRFMESTRTREPAVFGSALKHEQVQVDPKDSQFIDLLRFEVEQVCRFYRVPPSMVYGSVSGQSVTYANVSQADLHYLKHSLDGYLVRIEKALGALLPRPQQVKFNRDALLRADTLTRYQAHQIGIDAGFLERNEVRELEDRPPLDTPPTPDAPPPTSEDPNGLTP